MIREKRKRMENIHTIKGQIDIKDQGARKEKVTDTEITSMTKDIEETREVHIMTGNTRTIIRIEIISEIIAKVLTKNIPKEDMIERMTTIEIVKGIEKMIVKDTISKTSIIIPKLIVGIQNMSIQKEVTHLCLVIDQRTMILTTIFLLQ